MSMRRRLEDTSMRRSGSVTVSAHVIQRKYQNAVSVVFS